MEIKIILFSCLILLTFISILFLFKKIIFRIVSVIILIIVCLISVNLSDRWFLEKQSSTMYGKKLIYENQKIEEGKFNITEVNTYSLSQIDEADVPNRIKVLKLFSNQCNQKDSIIKIYAIGQIKPATFWFIKKENNSEAKGFLKY